MCALLPTHVSFDCCATSLPRGSPCIPINENRRSFAKVRVQQLRTSMFFICKKTSEDSGICNLTNTHNSMVAGIDNTSIYQGKKTRNTARYTSIHQAFRVICYCTSILVHSAAVRHLSTCFGKNFTAAETRRLIINIFIIFSPPMHKACNMQW